MLDKLAEINTLISVIIPVYNAQNELRRMVDSILVQSYASFELLLINDGSNDESLCICEALAQKDMRVRVYNKPNEGPSATRNLGIELSQGKYILFLDSDDYIEPDMFSSLIGTIEREQADLVICGFTLETQKNGIPSCQSKNSVAFPPVFGNKQVRAAVVRMLTGTLINPLWNKLFKRGIIESHDLTLNPEISYGEDMLFCLDYLSHCESMVVIPDCHYHYIQYEKPTLANIFRADKIRIMSEWSKAAEVFAADIYDADDTCGNIIHYLKVRWFYACVVMLVRAKQPYARKRETIKKIFADNTFASVRRTGLSKFEYMLSRLFLTKNISLVYCSAAVIDFFKNRFRPHYLRILSKSERK